MDTNHQFRLLKISIPFEQNIRKSNPSLPLPLKTKTLRRGELMSAPETQNFAHHASFCTFQKFDRQKKGWISRDDFMAVCSEDENILQSISTLFPENTIVIWTASDK